MYVTIDISTCAPATSGYDVPYKQDNLFHKKGTEALVCNTLALLARIVQTQQILFENMMLWEGSTNSSL
ncbi:g5356 [Coccomyxa elongata]